MKFIRKTVFTLGLLASTSYLGICTFLYFYQTRLIFKPDRTLSLIPEDLQLDYEEVWLPINDSDQLHGWWLPALPTVPSGPAPGQRFSRKGLPFGGSSSTAAGSSSERVLLYFHGNGENIGGNLEHAHRYQQMGFSVFLFDYRGYGLSQGPFPSEQRVYQDAATAWAYLTQTRKIPASSIWIFGHSLGGAVAIDLAQKQPGAAGLIVESSFSSMRDAVLATGDYNWIPVRLLLNQQFNSLAKVSQLAMPVFYIHGLEDGTVPAAMSQILYEYSPEPKALWFVPEADHNTVADVAGERYFEMVQQFIATE